MIRKPLGYQQITVLTSAVGFTSPPKGANRAMLICTGQDVRWRDDGTNPTATVGFLLTTGINYIYEGDLEAIKFIQSAATAVLNISYYD